MSVGGKKNTGNGEQTKSVGLFLGKVVAINPTVEQFKERLGIELKEDSKATEYLGTSKDGNTTLRVDFWILQDGTTDMFRKVSYFLEDKDRKNKDETKTQYVNSVGMCTWSETGNNFPDWFAKRSGDIRVAKVGEEDFYAFIRTWLGGIDFRDKDSTLELDWKKLMKGNVKELKDLVDSEHAVSFGAMATVISKAVTNNDTGEQETKEFQSVYNKMVIPEFAFKAFKLVNYHDPKVQAVLQGKASKDLKTQERFVLNVIGEYGCKDFYSFKEIHEYDSTSNPVASSSPITNEGSESDDDY